MLRRLRIAVSVFFALVAVGLCVFWVRSYRGLEIAFGPIGFGNTITLSSRNGSIWISTVPQSVSSNVAAAFPQRWTWWVRDVGPGNGWQSQLFEFAYRSNPTGRTILFPYWLPVTMALIVSVAIVGKLPRSYSLRTLLIATTLIAVVLGMAV